MSRRDRGAEEKLELLREEIISLVSHELRTPLAHIKGYASTLLLDGAQWDDAERRGFVEAIDHQADRLARLLDALLEAVRVSSLVPDMLNRRAIVPAELIDRVVGKATREGKANPLTISAPIDLPRVLGEPGLIECALETLLDNAATYSQLTDPIRIEAYHAVDEVVFVVHDHGIGLTADEHAHLFERFYRSPRAKYRAPGLGLGLATCQRIVQLHGGRVWAERSDDPRLARGSTFCFTLPLAPGEALESETEETREPA